MQLCRGLSAVEPVFPPKADPPLAMCVNLSERVSPLRGSLSTGYRFPGLTPGATLYRPSRLRPSTTLGATADTPGLRSHGVAAQRNPARKGGVHHRDTVPAP